MNAIIKPFPAPGLHLAHVPIPNPGPNDVLIKIRKTAICGTDLTIDKWGPWAQQRMTPPVIVGHEYCGTIVELGENVTDFSIGDRVSGEGHIVCGHCRSCLCEKRHLCPNTKGIGSQRDGAFAEFLCLPATNVWLADPHIPDEILACFDPFGNAVHTALTFDLLGKDVLITGAGPIGCMVAGIAKHAGARSVVITDLNPYRLDLATKMGASVAFNIKDKSKTLKEVMRDLEIHDGFDVGLEMSGSAQALSEMVNHMVNGGNIALLGILPDGAPIEWLKVIFNELTLKGIYGRKIFETWYQSTTLLQSGLDISPIITHRFPYKHFREAFDLIYSGQCGKVILEWE